MTLADYLKAEGNSASKLADSLGVAVSTVTRIAKGEITPSRDIISAIFEQTKGQVTPNDIFGITPTAASPEATGAEAA